MTGSISFFSISGSEGENSIEASIHALEVDGDLLLLDAGFMSTGRQRSELGENRMLLTLEKIKALEPRLAGILVSHAHLDHIGLLPHVYYLLNKVPIYMTAFTKDIARILLKDALKVSPAFYSKNFEKCCEGSRFNVSGDSKIDEMLASDRIHVCSFEEPTCYFQIQDTKVKALRAGHIPGAASFLMRGKNNSTVLYTGDYSRTDFLTVEAAPVPTSAGIDLMITESTYGETNDVAISRESEVQGFIAQLRETLSSGGRVLIPSFALGRAQEILAILLKSMKEDGTLQAYPIRILGMARNITYLCTEDDQHRFVTPWATKNFGELFKSCMYAGCSGGLVQFPASNYEVENALVYDNGPAVFIAPSGMLTGGWSPKIASYLAKEPTSAILLVGYQDEESPGKKFQELTKSKVKNKSVALQVDPYKPPKLVNFACKVGEYKLSAHVTGNEIVDFVHKWKPRNLFLIHGPTKKAKTQIAVEVKSLLPDSTIQIPKNNLLYKISS